MDEWRLEPARDLGLSTGQRLRSLQRESGLIETLARFAWWTAVRTYLTLAHRLSVTGREHIPAAPPFVLVANHCSHLDTLVLAASMRRLLWDRVFPIAAGDTFFETPIVAAFAAGLLNALPMWRRNCGSHALRELRQRLTSQPCAYILFPEGTRSRTGQMSRFRPGLGMIVAGTTVPVVPAFVNGTFAALDPDRRIPRPRKITVTIGEPLEFSKVSNTREGWNRIATQTETAVRTLSPDRR
ncbi:MAG: lysophospholipid acyltransferase family protein [Phycisphaerales bacterium]